jgi:hypothetical protein
MKTNLLTGFLSILLTPLIGQGQTLKHIESKGNYFSRYEILLESDTLHEFKQGFPFSGLAFQIDLNESFDGCYIILNGEKIMLEENVHDQETVCEGIFRTSELIHCPPDCQSFTLYSSRKISPLYLHVFKARATLKNLPDTRRLHSDSLYCLKPLTIDQSIWRDGLPSPTVSPTYTEPDHVVIHHTAGSNSNTDYTTTIRNIYLYHTLTNGWDDIGYNYVIARDGTIYDGRDGQGIVEEDYVKGAHFCGKNSNTMGVSIMGTYTDLFPPDTALESLKHLLCWKLHKDGLHALDSLIHPRASGFKLPVICGHKDGCPTECPGEKFHQILPSLRTEVWQLMQSCQTTNMPASRTDITIFPSPAENFVYIRSHEDVDFSSAPIYIYHSDGREIYRSSYTNKDMKIDVSSFNPGIYILIVRGSKSIWRKVFLVK